MNPQELTDAILHMKWLPLAIILIGYLTRLLSDKSKFPVSVPTRWQPVIVVVLGQLYGSLMLLQQGATWKAAVVTGLVTSLFTMGLFSLVVKAIFGGKPPWWIDILALVFPGGPAANECRVNPLSSAMCSRGTKSCTVLHDELPVINDEKQDPPATAA